VAIAPPHAAQRSTPPVSSQKRRPQLETCSLSLMASLAASTHSSRNARVRNRHADPLLPCAISWLGALSTAQKLALLGGVLALSLLAGQWWFLVHLLRQNGRLLVRLEAVEATLAEGGSVVAPSANGTPVDQAEGLPVGSAALEFSLSGVHGETITLEALRSSGKPVMLLFTDPGCSPCNAMS
jgi:hypothetical protein